MLVQRTVTSAPGRTVEGRYTRASKVMQLPNNADIELDDVDKTSRGKRIAWMVFVVFAIWTAIGLMNTLQRIANTTDMRESYPVWTLIKLGMGTHWLKAILSFPLVLL